MSKKASSITCPVCNKTSYNLNDILHGYCGFCHDFTTHMCSEASGALPNTTLVRKTNTIEGDTHMNGATGYIWGSVGPVEVTGDGMIYGYFVEWDDQPGRIVFIKGTRIEPIGHGTA